MRFRIAFVFLWYCISRIKLAVTPLTQICIWTMFFRRCPTCDDELSYLRISDFTRAERRDQTCQKCSLYTGPTNQDVKNAFKRHPLNQPLNFEGGTIVYHAPSPVTLKHVLHDTTNGLWYLVNTRKSRQESSGNMATSDSNLTYGYSDVWQVVFGWKRDSLDEIWKLDDSMRDEAKRNKSIIETPLEQRKKYPHICPICKTERLLITPLKGENKPCHGCILGGHAKARYNGLILHDKIRNIKFTVKITTTLLRWAQENGFRYQDLVNVLGNHVKGMNTSVRWLEVVTPYLTPEEIK